MGLLQGMSAGTPALCSAVVLTLCCSLHTSLAALEVVVASAYLLLHLEHRLAAACRLWRPLNASTTMEWTSRSTMCWSIQMSRAAAQS